MSGHTGSLLLCGLFSGCDERGPLSGCGVQASLAAGHRL